MRTKRYEQSFEKERLGGSDKIVAKAIADKSVSGGFVGKSTLENFEKLFKMVNEKLAVT